MPRGGARPGSGRKGTGSKTKSYTITLPEEAAAVMESIAGSDKKSINMFIREAIMKEYVYPNIKHLPDLIEDDPGYSIDK